MGAPRCFAAATGSKEVNYALYLVTDDNHLDDQFLSKIEGAIKGGATCVQLRLKEVTTLDYVTWAEKVQVLTRAAGVPLIIDDRLDVALAVDCEGLHIGSTDMPWRTARRLLGPNKILGCSTYGREDLVREALSPEVRADYLGSGAIFGSPTKHKSTAKGIDHLAGLRKLVKSVAGSRTVPICAIGGVDLDSAGPCIEGGADGIAVVSGLLRYADAAQTQAAAEKMLAAVNSALEKRVE